MFVGEVTSSGLGYDFARSSGVGDEGNQSG